MFEVVPMVEGSPKAARIVHAQLVPRFRALMKLGAGAGEGSSVKSSVITDFINDCKRQILQWRRNAEGHRRGTQELHHHGADITTAAPSIDVAILATCQIGKITESFC